MSTVPSWSVKMYSLSSTPTSPATTTVEGRGGTAAIGWVTRTTTVERQGGTAATGWVTRTTTVERQRRIATREEN